MSGEGGWSLEGRVAEGEERVEMVAAGGGR